MALEKNDDTSGREIKEEENDLVGAIHGVEVNLVKMREDMDELRVVIAFPVLILAHVRIYDTPQLSNSRVSSFVNCIRSKLLD